MILFDYECSEHGVFEAWGSVGQKAPCPRCGKRCRALPARPGIKLEGMSGDFPRAARMWADRHERHEEPQREV